MSSVTFPTAIGGDGSTVTDDDNATTGLRNGGWRTRFIPCFTNLVNIADYVVTYTAQTTAFATPPPIGSTTPNTGAFTRVTVTGSTAPANGIYLPGTNSLGFATNSSERVRIDASGNVGIGTSSPTGKLQVKAANPQIFMEDSAAGTNGKFTAIGTSNGTMTFSRYLDNGSLVGQYMTLDSSGNLGLGVTPSAWGNQGKAIQVGAQGAFAGYQYSAANNQVWFGNNCYTDQTTGFKYIAANPAANLRIVNDGSFQFNQAASGPAGGAISFTQAMTLDASGNLLVGTTSGPTNARFVTRHSVSNAGVAFIQSGSSAYTDSVLTVSCDTSAGTGFNILRLQALAGTVCQVLGNGNIQNTNNSYGAISDENIKENIVDATPKLQDLLAVKIRNFNIKGDSAKQIGVVAQELEDVFPSMIEENADRLKGVKYSVFVPMLVKAIQEMHIEIQELKQRIH